ncbi:ribose-5-phosphate isomerase RpiA [Sphingomonas sp. H39-1-10]|uniref:ribose-5-phosphate isomerase RpiA n=1 Tax=Sphingomonas pollutisoli TaxID=3030829 RepID=UPI0023BA034B|nr:ribose-5-phosphate isomerase RpiA [Sphingomonas pollutisoli]MDF0487027.1 ribose-5-phosphate isomerase RpiA [Sphingomonas pollutisoli]
MNADEDKRAAANAAVGEIADGMLVGLGTGSTAAFAIARLGERVRAGLRVRAVATSLRSLEQARAAGIDTLDFADVAATDLAIDGADEIDARLHAIKGAGGAMLREKIVAESAARMIVIADGSKRVAAIGAAKLPVEVLPFARSFVTRRVADLGAAVTVRGGAAAPFRTDQGNLVLDCRFAALGDPFALAEALAAIPGVLGHGLFLREIDSAIICEQGQVTRIDRPV